MVLGFEIGLRNCGLFIYGWAVKFCHREYGMNNEAVTNWNNYLRKLYSWGVQQNKMLIGRDTFTVEFDKSIFTRRKKILAEFCHNNGCLAAYAEKPYYY